MENGDHEDEYGFDDLELHKNRAQAKSVKAFAEQRRKVKPNRKHVASRNPMKILQTRDNVRDDLNDEDDVDGEEDGEEEENDLDAKRSKVNGVLNKKSDRLVGRVAGMNTPGKIKIRDVELAGDAKKGLETKEDLKGASRSLRVTEKDRKTGIGTEKTNKNDGVKDVMLFHVKGARHVQTRLVEPKTSSMNSGDVFVLVTPKYVHQWNGKNCSIMEKSRGAELASVIQQWKELGCNATNINIMDENREKSGTQTKDFWMKLGDKKFIRNIEDVLDDKIFEKGILSSNHFYEIICEGNEEDEDAECYLEEIEEYMGKVPSKKWLDSNKAYVLDFGTEVYSWIGRYTKGSPRRKAVDIGLEHYNKGYKTKSNVHPYNLNKESKSCDIQQRPDWSIYGRMAEKTESVAFRKKFFDWPDPVDLKVKTVEAKVHAQLTKEYSGDANLNTLLPIPAKELIQPTEEPLMILDGGFIGRGKGMQDMETLFKYGVTLNELTIWQVSANSFEELPQQRYGVFYSAEAYIIKWNFQIFRTGIRHLKGGKSRQDDAGKDRIVFFFWQGRDCSSSDKGTAALMTVEMDTEEGPQIPVHQGREPPCFFQLFDGKMVVHEGKVSDEDQFKRVHLYWVRNEEECETCLYEVKLSSASLRSRGSYLVLDVPNKQLYVWNGVKATETTLQRGKQAANNLKENLSTLYSKKVSIVEVNEGEETDALWDALSDEEDYMSYLEVGKLFDFTPRCFAFDSLHGYFQQKEITSTAYHPSYICPFPMLQSDLHELSQPGLVLIDAHHKTFLWQGWWPASDDESIDATGPNTHAEKHRFDVNRKLAMQSIKLYMQEKGKPLSRAYLIFAGCEPLEFKNLFPFWHDDEDVVKRQLEAGHTPGEKRKLSVVLSQLEKDEYTLAELTTGAIPEGVDPSRLEQYLNKDQFKKLFGLPKAEYPKLPRWKQIELKKKAGLF